MKIKRIEDGSKSEWVWNEKEKSLIKRAIGRIQLVSVCDDSDEEVYQAPVWLEQRGEIDIIVNNAGKIAFIETVRHAVIPPDEYAAKWSDWKKDGIPHLADLNPGVTQLEIPRGFTSVTLREAEEEARYKVAFVAKLGHVNPNTAFFGTSPFVYVYRASSVPADVQPDPHEAIKRVVWLSPEETREVNTLCGLTFASLFIFRRWAMKQKDDFWQEIGKRL